MTKATPWKKRIRLSLFVLIGIGLLVGVFVAVLNVVMVLSASDQIITVEEAAAMEPFDCILVLGCGVKEDGTPSHMLEDRLKQGIALQKAGTSQKLLMSGDHHTAGYNEVQVMKDYAKGEGIASSDVFMDHAGLNTYDSLWRAKEIFCAKRILIVTQAYHLPRALAIAGALGLEAYGVSADLREYRGQFMRDAREILARTKDFVQTLFLPDATIDGTEIPITGDGDQTND